MCSIAVGVVLGFPAATDGDGSRGVKFENVRRDVRDRMGTVAKRRILSTGATTVCNAFRYLFYDGGLNQIVVR
jgi:hypothetical protein